MIGSRTQALSFRHQLRCIASALLVVTVAVASLGSAASAQVETEPHEVPAGQATAVSFVIERGCGGDSPTVKLEIEVPEGIDDARFIPIEGWTGSTSGRRVTITGGPLPAGELAYFGIEFTAPDAEGSELAFPIVQTCTEESLDLRSPAGGLGLPAPVVVVGPAEVEEQQSTATTGDAQESQGREGNETSSVSWFHVLGVGTVAALLVGGCLLVRRRGREGDAPSTE